MRMKRKKCMRCQKAKNGEPLWRYDGELMCAYCIASAMAETSIGVLTDGWVGDKIEEEE